MQNASVNRDAAPIHALIRLLHRFTHLLDHAELIDAFRLRARVRHRPFNDRIRRNPTKPRTKSVPQIVNREMRHACSPQGGTPRGLNAADWRSRFSQTRKDVRRVGTRLFFPLLRNAKCQVGGETAGIELCSEPLLETNRRCYTLQVLHK